jgi:hypothetical protein
VVDLKIFQVVFSLKGLRSKDTSRATVYAGNLTFWPTQSVLCRLRCPASRDQNGMVFSIRVVRPKKMIVCAASLAVLPEPLIFFESLDRWRVRITFVEIPDLFCYIRQW